jgi:hypothetical protein
MRVGDWYSSDVAGPCCREASTQNSEPQGTQSDEPPAAKKQLTGPNHLTWPRPEVQLEARQPAPVPFEVDVRAALLTTAINHQHLRRLQYTCKQVLRTVNTLYERFGNSLGTAGNRLFRG